MSVEYSVVESALITRLIETFSELSDTRCRAGDVDGVFNAIFEEGEDYGCLIEFGGGRDAAKSPFDKSMWTWRTDCIFFIRYGEDIETKMRAIVDKLAYLTAPGQHTLGGTTPLARLYEIGVPEPGTVNDIPFYWIPFTVEIIGK